MNNLFWVFLIAANASAEPRTLEPALVIPAATTSAAIPDRRFVFGMRSGTILVWSAITGQLIAQAAGQSASIDTKTGIALVGCDIWDLNERRHIDTVDHGGLITGLTPDGRFAVFGRDDIQVVSMKRRAVVGRIASAHPTFIAFSENAALLALGRGAQFDIYDLKTGRIVKTNALAGVWPFRTKPTKGFSEFVDRQNVDFSVVYEQANVERFDETAQPLYKLDWDSESTNMFSMPHIGADLGARPQGNDVILSLSADPSAEHARLTGHRAAVKSIAFSPDRWTMASGDGSGEVRIWDIFSGKQISQFAVEGGTITSLGFSPDSQFLLAASRSEIRVVAISP